MAGVACFSGRISTQHTHTDNEVFVPTRQAHRLSKFALAAPSQRLRSTRVCRQGMIVARAALAMPELGVRMSVPDQLVSDLLTRKGCSSFCSQVVVMRHNLFESRLKAASRHTISIGTLVSARPETPKTQSSHLVSRCRARSRWMTS